MGTDGPCCEGRVANINDSIPMCVPRTAPEPILVMQNEHNVQYYLVCVGGTVSGTGTNNNYPNGNKIQCNGGRFVLVGNNTYTTPTDVNTVDANTPRTVYYQAEEGNDPYTNPIPFTPTGNGYFIHYGN